VPGSMQPPCPSPGPDPFMGTWAQGRRSPGIPKPASSRRQNLCTREAQKGLLMQLQRPGHWQLCCPVANPISRLTHIELDHFRQLNSKPGLCFFSPRMVQCSCKDSKETVRAFHTGEPLNDNQGSCYHDGSIVTTLDNTPQLCPTEPRSWVLPSLLVTRASYSALPGSVPSIHSQSPWPGLDTCSALGMSPE
jgi:hypothetical protein